ncbi:hypothetical protein B296_00014089 [Ensete ventricosum]|uniref:Uncharacterized protein n=1 Tax=Ensete ventricosum TaxID=4639 RepID=A0A427A2W7_ENSVE|nr:hypothetical protein B296_00014089 [Ensete ventricosum]
MVTRKNMIVINFEQSRVSINFSCTVSEIQNTRHSRRICLWKSNENGFMKKCYGHKLCAKLHAESSFDRFFVHHLENSKNWPFPIVEFRLVFHAPSRKFKIMAIPDEHIGNHTSKVSQKNVTVINFARSHTQSRVSIDFSCTVSEIHNSGLLDVLAHWKSYTHGFVKNHNGH